MDLSKYIGIPFKDHGRGRDGCDCWGLVHLVYREQLGITMHDLGDAYSDAYARGDVDMLVDAVAGENWNVDVTAGPWKPMDVMIFRRCGVEAHVGLYLRPGEMLHVVHGMCAAVERYNSAKWGRRLSRVLRHVDACR
jgi:cell wall-associated NlpC family hydrolase